MRAVSLYGSAARSYATSAARLSNYYFWTSSATSGFHNRLEGEHGGNISRRNSPRCNSLFHSVRRGESILIWSKYGMFWLSSSHTSIARLPSCSMRSSWHRLCYGSSRSGSSFVTRWSSRCSRSGGLLRVSPSRTKFET